MSNNLPTIKQNNDMISAVDKLHGISVNTRNTYRYQIQSYLNYCQKNSLPQNIDTVEKWVESSNTTTTANHRISTIKRILKTMYNDLPPIQRIELDDSIKRLDDIKPYKTEKRTKYLTKKEIDKLLLKMPEHISLITEFIFQTGFRIYPTITMKLYKCKKVGGIIEVSNIHKGRKDHTMYITIELFNRIKKYFKGAVYLFEHDGKHYTTRHISAMIAKWSSEILKKRVTAHSIRHSFATYQHIGRGLPITTVQAGLGHSKIDTTMRYTHLKATAKDFGIK